MRVLKIIVSIFFFAGPLHSQIVVKGRIDHIIPDGTDTLGNIYLTVSGGTSPYTYTWMPGGSNVKDLTDATANSYTVTVKDNVGATVSYKYKVGYKSRWTNFISCFLRNDSIIGQNVAPYYPNTFWNTSVSKTTLKAGQDGWVQWVAGPTNYQIMVGFSDSTTVAATGLYSDIDYGIYLNTTNLWRIVAGSASALTTVASGDVIRIERVGTTLTYYKNSTSVISYTVSTARDWKLKAVVNGTYTNANIGANFADTTSSNFPHYVEDIPVIVHSSPGSSNGSVKLSPRISGTSHSYTWSPSGATTTSISSLATGNYGVDIKDSDSNLSKYTYNIGNKTYWTNLYFTKFQNDSIITLSPASHTGWSTALSKNTLLASTNGWVEFVYNSNGSQYMVGFVDSASVLSGVYSDIDYGIYMAPNRVYRIIGGVYTTIATLRVGDILRMERSGSTFYIKINNHTTYSTTCSTSAWKIKSTIYTSGNITNIGASFVDTTNVNFKNYVEDKPVITHCTPGSNNGSIKLTPRINGTSHNYTWSPGGATTSSITGLSMNTYSVISKDSDGNASSYNYFNVGYKTYWTNFYGTNVRNDSILFNSPLSPTGWNTTISKNTLNSGVNGWVEFVTRSTTDYYMLGFLDSASAVAGVTSDIDFGVTFANNGVYKASGGVLTYICAYRSGDIIHLDRTGSVFNMKLNGALVHTVTANASIPLKIKAALQYTTVANVGCSFIDSTSIAFPNYVRITPKIISTLCIESNDGSISAAPKYSGATQTYTWLPDGELTSLMSSKKAGIYTVIAKDSYSNTSQHKHNIGYKTTWGQFYNSTSSNDTLKNSGSVWASAVSTNSLLGNTDGWLEYVIPANTYTQVVGFLDSSITMSSTSDIDYAIFLEGNTRKIYRYLNGASTLLGAYDVGDIIRIDRIGNALNFKINNAILSTVTVPTATLSKTWKIKGMINSSGSKLTEVGCSSPLFRAMEINPTQIDAYCVPGTGAKIDLHARGGLPPYNFSWSNSATTEIISGMPAGVYSANATDATGMPSLNQSFTITNCPKWNYSEASEITGNSNGDLTKNTSTNDWNNTFVKTTEPFAFANDSVWLNFTVADTLSNLLLGFGTYSPDTLLQQVNYKLYQNGSKLIVIESDNDGFYNKMQVGTLLINDRLKIDLTKEAIKYYKNDQLLYVSKLFSDRLLRVEGEFYGGSSVIKKVRVSKYGN